MCELLCLQVLNEVVVDRGPSAYIGNLDLYIEHKCITSVQGDGISRTLKLRTILTVHLVVLSVLDCRRSDHFHSDRKYRLRSCSGSVDGPPERACHRHRSRVRTLALLPPDHHTGWRRDQGECCHCCDVFSGRV